MMFMFSRWYSCTAILRKPTIIFMRWASSSLINPRSARMSKTSRFVARQIVSQLSSISGSIVTYVHPESLAFSALFGLVQPVQYHSLSRDSGYLINGSRFRRKYQVAPERLSNLPVVEWTGWWRPVAISHKIPEKRPGSGSDSSTSYIFSGGWR